MTSSPGRRATAKQNSPFSSLTVVVTIASTHCAYPRRDGQAEWAWVAGYVVRQFTCPKVPANPTTNRAQCRATALMETNNALPLHLTATQRINAVVTTTIRLWFDCLSNVTKVTVTWRVRWPASRSHADLCIYLGVSAAARRLTVVT